MDRARVRERRREAMADHSYGVIRDKTLKLTVTSIFMAMNIVLSLSAFSVPVPGGHIYFCDVLINTAAMLLDPLSAFVVGGIGSFLGDFFFYPAPMFVSLVAHGLQAVVVSLVMRKGKGRPGPAGLGVILGSVIMVFVYTLGRAYVYATPEVAIIKLPFECLQAGIGAAGSLMLVFPLHLKDMFFRSMNR